METPDGGLPVTPWVPPGKRIRYWCLSVDTTLKALAATLPCSRPHLSNIARGASTPGLELAARIEEVTGIPAAEWARVRAGLRGER